MHPEIQKRCNQGEGKTVHFARENDIVVFQHHVPVSKMFGCSESFQTNRKTVDDDASDIVNRVEIELCKLTAL